MTLRMWMLDIAREQSTNLELLRELCQKSLAAGYNAIGLYLEHRFDYPSVPWVGGKGALTPATVKQLELEFPNLMIIPFINLLGHMEGFLNTEAGHHLAEQRFMGMQACPSKPEFVDLCHKIIDDALSCFSSPIIHIGGDETSQLGSCAQCSAKVKLWESEGVADGKAKLYGEHFAGLVQRVVDAGRRPAVWGDMFFDHPTALEIIPREALIFDWQYFKGPEETSRLFRDRGFEVVYCPAVHTYNAAWLHLPQSEENVKEHALAARQDQAYGVCVTTWEFGLMANFETAMPFLWACGEILSDETIRPSLPPYVGSATSTKDEDVERYKPLREAPIALKHYLREGERYEEWARLMGIELLSCGGVFAFSGIRSGIKARLMLYSNPFLLWLRQREEFLGDSAASAVEILGRALAMAPEACTRGVTEFVQLAISSVQRMEEAQKAYASERPGEAASALFPIRMNFEQIERLAIATHLRCCGSLADIGRARAGREHVERVIRRVKEYGDGSLGYLPSFEMLCHPKFIPHDQAGWWIVNKWANE